MAESEWISIGEAERLTGLSTRTIKRMVAEGQLSCSRSPGNHMRVSRADVERLLRREAPVSGAASSVLANKRERVEELSLELQLARAQRELKRFTEEDAEGERQRADSQRARELADLRAIEESRLQAERNADRRAREEREVQQQRARAEFRRKWVGWAVDRFPAWPSFEQRQTLLAAIETTIAARDPEDGEIMRFLLWDTMNRIYAGWDLERRTQERREDAVTHAVTWDLPIGATDADKASAAASARSALAQIPPFAADSEIRSAVGSAIQPIVASIEERRTAERCKESERLEAERAKVEERRAAERQKENERLEAERARIDSPMRNARKSRLVSAGVERVSTYLSELHGAGEITRDAYLDFDWRRELQNDVREILESELSGTDEESEQTARKLAEDIVDEELE
jgi:excisionase family DNA binding protein